MAHLSSLAIISALVATIYAADTTANADEEHPEIAAVKATAKVATFLEKYAGDHFEQQFESLTLRNGSCGFAGCSWKRLVSITVTHLVSNSPSTTIHAVVSGTSPSIGPATVEFVELDLKPMSESRWNWEAGN